jgi:hypothetical protein
LKPNDSVNIDSKYCNVELYNLGSRCSVYVKGGNLGYIEGNYAFYSLFKLDKEIISITNSTFWIEAGNVHEFSIIQGNYSSISFLSAISLVKTEAFAPRNFDIFMPYFVGSNIPTFTGTRFDETKKTSINLNDDFSEYNDKYPRNFPTIVSINALDSEYTFVFCAETGLLYNYDATSGATVDNLYVLSTADGGDTRFVSVIGANTSDNLVTKTADYTVQSDDNTIVIDASLNTVDITVPTAASSTKKKLTIKTINITNQARVLTAGGNINGDTEWVFTEQYESITIQSDGTRWLTI